METPDSTPSPKSEKTARIERVANKANKWIAIVAIIVVALIYFGQKSMMGKRYKVTETESVNYSEKATEEDAKKVGEVLKATGYFSGKGDKDVLLKRNEKEGTVVSFVGGWNVNDEGVASSFKQIGEALAAGGLGKPLTIRLLDTHLNKTKDFTVE